VLSRTGVLALVGTGVSSVLGAIAGTPHENPAQRAAVQQIWLLRVRETNRTFALSADGIITRPLPHLPIPGEVSPDKTRLLHVSLERDHYKLFVTDLERLQTRRLIEWDVGEAHWLRDGREVIFCSPGDKGVLQVYRMDATGKNIARLTDEPEGAESPRPARDGRIAYVAARWKKRLEEVRRLPWDERIAAKGTLNPYDLIVMGPQGPQTILRDSLLHDYASSPDGTMIAWSTYGALELVNIGDGSKRRSVSPNECLSKPARSCVRCAGDQTEARSYAGAPSPSVEGCRQRPIPDGGRAERTRPRFLSFRSRAKLSP
jgi:hypothetical protein